MIIRGYIGLIFIKTLLLFLVIVEARHSESDSYCGASKTYVSQTQIPSITSPPHRNNGCYKLHIGNQKRDVGEEIMSKLGLQIRTKDNIRKPRKSQLSKRIKFDLNLDIFRVMEEEFRRRIQGFQLGEEKNSKYKYENYNISLIKHENILSNESYRNYSSIYMKNSLDYGFSNIQREVQRITENDHIPPIIIEIGGENHQYDDDTLYAFKKSGVKKCINAPPRSCTFGKSLVDPLINIGTITKPYTLYLVILLSLF